jgi:ABC-2 type transport system permease protein
MMLSQAIFLPTMMLSGIMFPAAMLPELLQLLGRFLPTTYIMQSFSGLAFKLHTDINASLSLLVTAGIGVVT